MSTPAKQGMGVGVSIKSRVLRRICFLTFTSVKQIALNVKKKTPLLFMREKKKPETLVVGSRHLLFWERTMLTKDFTNIENASQPRQQCGLVGLGRRSGNERMEWLAIKRVFERSDKGLIESRSEWVNLQEGGKGRKSVVGGGVVREGEHKSWVWTRHLSSQGTSVKNPRWSWC